MTVWLILMGCDVAVDADLATPTPRTIATAFRSPVGPVSGEGYYDAQPFGTNAHLGADFNGVGGGNSDRGDPVVAAAAGRVTAASDLGGGWGNVVRIHHRLASGVDVETVYAHLDTMSVEVGDELEIGDPVGTLGDAGGRYLAHLHFELRTEVGAEIGRGYGEPEQGQVDPGPYLREY